MEPTPPIIRSFVTSLAHFFNNTCKPPFVWGEFHSYEKIIFPVSHFPLRTLKFNCSELNTRKQLYYIYNNIITTTNFYMFRSLLAHHLCTTGTRALTGQQRKRGPVRNETEVPRSTQTLWHILRPRKETPRIDPPPPKHLHILYQRIPYIPFRSCSQSVHVYVSSDNLRWRRALLAGWFRSESLGGIR